MPGIAGKFTQSAQGRLPWPGMTDNYICLPHAFGGSAWLMTRLTVGKARRSARSI